MNHETRAAVGPRLGERAARVRALLERAEPVLLDAFAAGSSRDGWISFDAGVANPEVAAFAAALFKRGCRGARATGAAAADVAPRVPYPVPESEGSDLCAPCVRMGEGEALAWLRSHGPRACVVIDGGFAALHPAFVDACAASAPFILDVAEGNKTLSTVRALLRHVEVRAGEAECFITVGGGLTSDLSGFAAGLCGAPFDVVPTTYLAAVDAGQGGKTGVNFPPYGKNQVGLFHGARSFRLVDTPFATLPTEERASGACEALKHCYLTGTWPAAGFDPAALTLAPEFLWWNMEAKSAVVRADPREKGVRRLLNLGHTLGHAWEGLQEEGLVTRLPHGVAVGLGIVALARAGSLRGVPESYLSTVDSLVAAFSPRRLAPFEAIAPALERFLLADKKNAGTGAVSLVTPEWGLLEPLAPRTAKRGAPGKVPGNEAEKPASFALTDEHYVTRMKPSECALALRYWL